MTLCHSQTANLADHTRRADLLVVAAGRPGLITGEMVGASATVVDVGTNYVDGRLVGDVVYEEVAERAARLTPVPGGVGPLTNLMLVRNLLDLADASPVGASAGLRRGYSPGSAVGERATAGAGADDEHVAALHRRPLRRARSARSMPWLRRAAWGG